MTQISIRLPDHDTAQIDELVHTGRYDTRTEFVALAVRRALATEREQRIAEQYRGAYNERPFPTEDEEWVRDASRRARRQ